MRMRRIYCVWCWMIILAIGCGHRDANLPKLMPVTGTVTMDGKPLSGAVVSFVPKESTRGVGANGYTDKSGMYELLASGAKSAKGTPAGEYRVMVMKLVLPDGSDLPPGSNIAPMESAARQILPAKYSNMMQSVLEATVGEGSNTIDFALSSKP